MAASAPAAVRTAPDHPVAPDRSVAPDRPVAPAAPEQAPWSAVPADFRDRATLGVSLIAVALLLPFAVTSLVRQDWALTAGTHGILLLLAANALCVRRGRRHQELTLYVLVPGGMLFMSGFIQVEPVAGVLWCYPSILACYCMLEQRRAWIANLVILGTALPATWMATDAMLAARVTATLLAVSAFAAILVRVIDVQQARLRRQIVTDALTGISNRLPLATALDGCVRERAGSGTPASLLALDLDHFKRVNDVGGHDAGDAVLRAVGALLRAEESDARRAFRTGGEEFLVLLPGVGPEGAARAAHGLCTAFRTDPLLAGHGATVSVGVATLRDGEDRIAWARRADALLYEAKRTGRDRVITDRDSRDASGPTA